MDNEQLIATAVEEPHVRELIDAYNQSLTAAGFYRERMSLADDTTWCKWDGQSDDGRRYKASDADPDPFPWEGACDNRVRLVDSLVRESVLIKLSSFMRGRWQVGGTQSTDKRLADKINVMLNWQIDTQMAPRSTRQTRLAAGWAVQYGVSVMRVRWHRKVQLGMQDISLDALAVAFGLDDIITASEQLLGDNGPADVLRIPEALDEMLGEARARGDRMTAARIEDTRDAVANYIDLIYNTDREAEFIDTVRLVFPTVSPKVIRKHLDELRTQGSTRLPQPYVSKDCPDWEALKVYEDVFFPWDTEDLQDARWIAVRSWETRSELEERKLEGWDARFVDAVLEHTEGLNSLEAAPARTSYNRRRGERGSWEAAAYDRDGMYELLTFYYWANDEYGVPGIYETAVSPHLPKKDPAALQDVYAYHRLLDYEHGKMPFIAHIFWQDSKTLLENVGIPYLLYTYQNEVKIARDYLGDVVSISMLPPTIRNVRDTDQPMEIAPDGVIIESSPGSTKWMTPPPSRADLLTIYDKDIRRDAARLVGSFHPEVPAPVAQLHQADLTDTFAGEMAEVLTMTLQLDQQFLPPTLVQRVSGPIRDAFSISREEIQGQYDLQIKFDPKTLDQEYALAKVKMLGDIKRSDYNNRINPDRMVELMVNELDADWADYLLESPTEVAAKEAEDELHNIPLILSGVEPPMKPGGQNYQLRTQVLEAQLRQNPTFQQQYTTNPLTQAIVDNRLKHLKFMAEQFTVNAEAGRTGTKPITQVL